MPRLDRRIGIAGVNVRASLGERIDRTLRGSASKAVARLGQRIDEHRLPNELTAARAHSCGVHITDVVVQAGRRLRNRNAGEELSCNFGSCDGVVVAPAIANEIVGRLARSEEHTSELQSLMRISYAVFCLKQKNEKNK